MILVNANIGKDRKDYSFILDTGTGISYHFPRTRAHAAGEKAS